MDDAASLPGYERQTDIAWPSKEDLHPLADELVAVAERLRKFAAAPTDVRVNPGAERAPRDSRRYLALARMAYSLRRKRAAIFGNPELFGEPAWDILLDLFIAHGEDKPVSVSSACIGSAAPATTGLRWLGVLAEEGLIVRENDAQDNRRVLVRLTRAGVTAMERFFDASESGG
ncbi:MarR family winged helix-turn-helix transcriptional regulator [Erythrobacter sp. NFXS35]|uniref:MarR family winged helix-turn-helix transcriptional regulator n=1 Tax=Erythrobacter sp. NFXS35 TaxID=2818436 RepID=UPI0032DE36EE